MKLNFQHDKNLLRQNKKIALKNATLNALVAVRKSDTGKIALLQAENEQMKKKIQELENMFHPEKNPGNTICYLEQKIANLEARVKRCDVVLCPVNCNSHNAGLKVKKLCNRHNKQLKILSNSSLSAVSQALFIPPENRNKEILN